MAGKPAKYKKERFSKKVNDYFKVDSSCCGACK